MPRGRRCWRRRHCADWTSGRSTGPPPYCSPCRSAQASGCWASRPPPSSIPMPRAACSAPPTCCSSRTPQTWGTRSAQAGLALTAAWTAAFAMLATVRLVRASPSRRRWSAPVLVPAVAAIVLFGADAVHGLDRGFVSNDPTDRALRLAEAGALALVAAGVALARLRTRRTRAALTRLVLDIGAAPAPGRAPRVARGLTPRPVAGAAAPPRKRRVDRCRGSQDDPAQRGRARGDSSARPRRGGPRSRAPARSAR